MQQGMLRRCSHAWAEKSPSKVSAHNRHTRLTRQLRACVVLAIRRAGGACAARASARRLRGHRCRRLGAAVAAAGSGLAAYQLKRTCSVPTKAAAPSQCRTLAWLQHLRALVSACMIAYSSLVGRS
eukprot:3050325-Pleurochrysis_carterae.AAC.2